MSWSRGKLLASELLGFGLHDFWRGWVNSTPTRLASSTVALLLGQRFIHYVQTARVWTRGNQRDPLWIPSLLSPLRSDIVAVGSVIGFLLLLSPTAVGRLEVGFAHAILSGARVA